MRAAGDMVAAAVRVVRLAAVRRGAALRADVLLVVVLRVERLAGRAPVLAVVRLGAVLLVVRGIYSLLCSDRSEGLAALHLVQCSDVGKFAKRSLLRVRPTFTRGRVVCIVTHNPFLVSEALASGRTIGDAECWYEIRKRDSRRAQVGCLY